ncbi:MAG TPA: galactokinase, partial [Trueperaceae bacterium]|nr:galactokinase [Trueperaceae bacterium]
MLCCALQGEFMTGQEKVFKVFNEKFGEEPKYIVRAPGRVNLIGEHTDYNDGFVLPMAIERSIWIALRPRVDKTLKVYSLHNNSWAEFEIDDISKGLGWLEYIKGVAFYLQDAGYSLNSWEGVIYGDIPRGAGLSSSAALELVSARAFFEVSNFTWNAKEMALIGQKVENDWLGLSSGIMDQLVVSIAKKGFASLIDCRSLETKNYPMQNVAVVIMDTNTRRGLVSSKYNERFAQCQDAAKLLGIKTLRDISLEKFEQNAHKLKNILRKRARHVISENERVLKATKALENSDFTE